jgi:hypothetical protein
LLEDEEKRRTLLASWNGFKLEVKAVPALTNSALLKIASP